MKTAETVAAPDVKLIIAGGRDFSDYALLKATMQVFMNEHYVTPSQITIISGMARGADILGTHWTYDFRTPLIKMPAWWRGEDGEGPYNKAAGHQRNERMAKIATHLLAFWDGKSTGTKSMIDLGVKYDLISKVVDYI